MTKNNLNLLESLKKISKTFLVPENYLKMQIKFDKIERDCGTISKNTIYSKEEVVNMVINQTQTSTMNLQQAYYFIAGKLS